MSTDTVHTRCQMYMPGRDSLPFLLSSLLALVLSLFLFFLSQSIAPGVDERIRILRRVLHPADSLDTLKNSIAFRIEIPMVSKLTDLQGKYRGI